MPLLVESEAGDRRLDEDRGHRGFFNAGQSCHAPSRMLVHESQVEQVVPFLVDE
ncbi:aldehyde dehydrogenase family protein, partial [Streptomyces sp. NPDC058368]|uniref:aldehyde dehydrogenase family protein n=1 Tax=Streptomyces sp. NPDC058368 TaxID=3346461 RepID=UPI0036472364